MENDGANPADLVTIQSPRDDSLSQPAADSSLNSLSQPAADSSLGEGAWTGARTGARTGAQKPPSLREVAREAGRKESTTEQLRCYYYSKNRGGWEEGEDELGIGNWEL